MKANKIFEEACALMGLPPDEADDLRDLTPHWMNVLLREVLPHENALRTRAGLSVLDRPYQLVEGNELSAEEIPYRDELCGIALAYGLASQMFMEDDNDYRAQDFRNRYIAALRETEKTKSEKVNDLY